MGNPTVDTSNITLCLTIGRRPELLQQTLVSLFKHAYFKHIIAINDFGDRETNDVFKALCPHGQLICLEKQLGHHKAVDYMYSHVKTDYIFHCEDDWHFNQLPDLSKILNTLDIYSDMAGICLRHYNDMYIPSERKHLINYRENFGVKLCTLKNVHPKWYGYSFNPHLVKTSLWQDIAGKFQKFRKERNISVYLRKKNRFMFYLTEGGCHHIGHDHSLVNPKTKQNKFSWLLKLKFKKLSFDNSL